MIINFPDSIFSEIYSINANAIARSLKILFIDILEDIKNTGLFYQTSEFYVDNVDDFINLQIKCFKVSATGHYALSLQSSHPDVENPLISHLINNSNLAFKLNFVFSKPVLESKLHQIIKNIMYDLESELFLLIRIFEKIHKLRPIIDNLIQDTLDTSHEAEKLGYQVIYEIEQISSTEISKKDKSKMIRYINYLIKHLESTIITKTSETKLKRLTDDEHQTSSIRVKLNINLIKEMDLSCNQYLKDPYHKGVKIKTTFINVIKKIFIEKVYALIQRHNSYSEYQEKIIQIFIKEINLPIYNTSDLITKVNQQIKRKWFLFKPVTLETKIFKTNTETFKLEEVLLS
ncbi:hypothetical protein CDIK_0543 [Cucumispora dikerogammari]|nr:hypothetical protein CDIK_0543 [Cucumispora dikerogammari]